MYLKGLILWVEMPATPVTHRLLEPLWPDLCRVSVCRGLLQSLTRCAALGNRGDPLLGLSHGHDQEADLFWRSTPLSASSITWPGGGTPIRLWAAWPLFEPKELMSTHLLSIILVYTCLLFPPFPSGPLPSHPKFITVTS